MMIMTESPRPDLDLLAADVRIERQAALRALQVLEYALAAPAPRRHRTWQHRVTVAVDALLAALHAQVPKADDPIGLLDEIALLHPRYIPRIQQLRQGLLDLTIAAASLRERLEPEPSIEVDPDEIRARLGIIARQFREHQANEADLVNEVLGRDPDEP